MDYDENNTISKSSLMSTLHSLFNMTTVKRQLMVLHSYNNPDEDQRWAEQAIEILAKKLRWKPTSLGELQRVLVDPSARPGQCVTIPRSNDGRMQIYQRKTQPHVTYCKLWRWADLRSQYELVGLSCCKYPFRPHSKDDDIVCVNPYHYRRKEATVVDEVRVDKQRNYHEQQDFGVTAGPEVNDSLDEILNYLQTAAESFEHQATPTDQQYQPQPVQNLNYSPAPVEQTSTATVQHHPHPTQDQHHSPARITESEAIPYREEGNWATIAYYELNHRVGQLFQCTQIVVRVDGYTSPVEVNRFCLGSLANCKRNNSIENVRQHIGDGVTLHHVGSEVYAECTSAKPIFVQSMLCNCQNGRNPIDVFKLEPGQSLKIFDTTFFANLLKRMVQQGFAATYELIKMCTIRMSFVKGWGTGYFRSDVTTTPCWIEITMNGPLKWLDTILIQMGSPPDAITSVS